MASAAAVGEGASPSTGFVLGPWSAYHPGSRAEAVAIGDVTGDGRRGALAASQSEQSEELDGGRRRAAKRPSAVVAWSLLAMVTDLRTAVGAAACLRLVSQPHTPLDRDQRGR